GKKSMARAAYLAQRDPVKSTVAPSTAPTTTFTTSVTNKTLETNVVQTPKSDEATPMEQAKTQTASTVVPVSDTKECPDCGETVKAAARICRFCRYEFHKPV